MEKHYDAAGSAAWHARRAGCFNAADAPAMLSCSANTTRTQLLTELKSGLPREFSDFVQERVLNQGHAIEDACRTIAEELVGEEMAVFACTLAVPGLSRPLGASFDGGTFMEDVLWECKTVNDALREALPNEGRDSHKLNDAKKLPKAYRVQMEQQLLASKAEKTLFTAARIGRSGKVEEERHAWYYPDLALRAEILAGWVQFDRDLVDFVPAEIVAPVIASAMESLPALTVQMRGELAVISNLPELSVALRSFIGRIPAKASTDQEFADTDSACKALKKFEEASIAEEESAIAKLSNVEEFRRLMADLRNLARTTRLQKEKDVEARKAQIRVEMVQGGQTALVAHIAALNVRLGKPYLPTIAADFGAAIKGKRTVESLRDAINTTLANAKIESNATADKIQINMGTLRDLAGAHTFLFPDTAQIALKAGDDFTALVKLRIAEHDAKEAARLEAERTRIRAEEQTKAEAAARDKLAAEAEAARMAKQREDKIAAEAVAAAAIELPSATPEALAPAAAVIDLPQPAARQLAPAPSTATSDGPPPTLRLGQIGERLGFGLTAEFLRTLGFEPAGRERAAVLYHNTDFPRICAALIAHISALRASAANAAPFSLVA